MATNEFFTMQSMLTLSGSVAATFTICNGMQRAFGFNPKWLGLLIALGISLFGVYYSTGKGEIGVPEIVIGIVNGFLIFCSAAGATEIGDRSKGENTTSDKPATYGGRVDAGIDYSPSAAGHKRKFFTSWFR